MQRVSLIRYFAGGENTFRYIGRDLNQKKRFNTARLKQYANAIVAFPSPCLCFSYENTPYTLCCHPLTFLACSTLPFPGIFCFFFPM